MFVMTADRTEMNSLAQEGEIREKGEFSDECKREEMRCQ